MYIILFLSLSKEWYIYDLTDTVKPSAWSNKNNEDNGFKKIVIRLGLKEAVSNFDTKMFHLSLLRLRQSIAYRLNNSLYQKKSI